MRPMTCSLTLGVMFGLFSQAYASDSFRCDGHIVEVGMTLDKVREYCGEPTQETGDRWIYDRGPEQFAIVIHVRPDKTVGLIEERPQE